MSAVMTICLVLIVFVLHVTMLHAYVMLHAYNVTMYVCVIYYMYTKPDAQ